MARRFQNRNFQRSRRPNRDWAALNAAVPITIAANTKVLLATFTLANPGIDETILRTVGSVAVASDQVAVTEDYMGAFGLRVVSDLAIAAGAASIPGPVTDAGDDGWFTYVSFANRFLFVTAAGLDPVGSMVVNFDSRSKRILEDGSSIAVMVENASATTGFIIATQLRVLGMVRGTG